MGPDAALVQKDEKGGLFRITDRRGRALAATALHHALRARALCMPCPVALTEAMLPVMPSSPKEGPLTAPVIGE